MSETAATPKPAATILLLRPGNKSLEVFMVVRHHQIDFASGALVFPGGKADPQDFEDSLIPHLQGAAKDTDMRAAQISAIREAFEECGILLAREVGSDDIISAERLQSLQEQREPMNKGEVTLLEFLQNEQLVLACDELTHFAHWITPPMMPKRFDTHFYLAIPPKIILLYTTAMNPWIRYGSIPQMPSAVLRTAPIRLFSRPCATLKNLRLGQHRSPPSRRPKTLRPFRFCLGLRSAMTGSIYAFL